MDNDSWDERREAPAAAQIRSGIVGGFLWHTAQPAKEMINNAAWDYSEKTEIIPACVGEGRNIILWLWLNASEMNDVLFKDVEPCVVALVEEIASETIRSMFWVMESIRISRVCVCGARRDLWQRVATVKSRLCWCVYGNLMLFGHQPP